MAARQDVLMELQDAACVVSIHSVYAVGHWMDEETMSEQAIAVRTCDGVVEGQQCSKCKRELPLRCFSRSSTGVNARCDECVTHKRRVRPVSDGYFNGSDWDF